MATKGKKQPAKTSHDEEEHESEESDESREKAKGKTNLKIKKKRGKGKELGKEYIVYIVNVLRQYVFYSGRQCR